MKILPPLLIVASLALGACSSDDTPTPTPLPAQSGSPTEASEPSTSPTPTAPATPVAWSEEEAQARYLGLVKPTNDALVDFNALLDSDSTDLPTYQEACQGMVDLDEALMTGLSEGTWPSSAQSAVDDLIKALSTERMAWSGCVSASSEDALVTAINSVGDNSAADEATLVRLSLGLPAN